MFESITIRFRRDASGRVREERVFDKPDQVNNDDGVLGILVGTDLHGFPLDTIEDTHIVLAEAGIFGRR